jgi:hypothetical protein
MKAISIRRKRPVVDRPADVRARPVHRLLATGLGTALAGLMLASFDAFAAHERYETPPVLRASEILPADLVSGRHYRVAQEVRNDGYMNHYHISTDFGEMTAYSNANLRKRIEEVAAIAAMAQVEESSEFTNAMQQAGKMTLTGLENLATDPWGTVSGAAAGIGRIFQGVGESLTGQAPPRSQGEGSQAENLIGFSKVKRQVASKFGVDVYSSNPILQKRLNDLAWASYAGGMSLRLAVSAVPGAGMAISASTTMQDLNEQLTTSSPSELRKLNAEKLRAMGVQSDLVDLFIDTTAFSPREQTLFVAALRGLRGASGVGLLVKVAVRTDRPEQAFFRQQQAQMYAGFEKKSGGIQRFVELGNLVAGVTRDGRLVVCAPVDYLVWTRSMAEFAEGANDRVRAVVPGVRRKELWVTGQLSPLALESIKARGWIVHEHSHELLKGFPL